MEESTVQAIKEYGTIMSNFGSVLMHHKYLQSAIKLYPYLAGMLPDRQQHIREVFGPMKKPVLEKGMKRISDFRKIAPVYLFEGIEKKLKEAERIYELYAFGHLGMLLHCSDENIAEKKVDDISVDYLTSGLAKVYGTIGNYYGKIHTAYDCQSVFDQFQRLLIFYFSEEKGAIDILCKPKIDAHFLEKTRVLIDTFRKVAPPELLEKIIKELDETKKICDLFALSFFGLSNNFVK